MLTDGEWKALNPIFDLARAAIAIPECADWLTSDIKYKFNSLKELNSLIADKRFKGGLPGSYATTYSNGGGTISIAWIGLRNLFFGQGRWEKVNTILHELRHAMHLGMLAHPFKSKAERDDWVINQGGTIETQQQFDTGVKKNCIDALKRAMGRL